MRAAAIGFLIAFALVPGPVYAQPAPPAGTGGPKPPAAAAAPPPGAITREDFVQRRAEAAGRLFDRIDTQHLGYITRAQMRAYFAQHRAGRAAGAGAAQHQ